MRLGSAMLLGLIAALLTLAAPTLARNSNHEQKTREAPASGCNAYQRAPDGTWTQLPCEEVGSKPATQPRSASKRGDEETR